MKYYLFWLLVFIQLSVLKSQNEFYNSGSGITVQAGALIFVQGEVVNTDLAANIGLIANSGTIALSGDWTNNSTSSALQPTTGNVELNGALQLIRGTQPTTFNNLTLLGTNIKRLDVNTFVGGINGVLSLTDRTLDLNSKTLFVTNSLNTAITRNIGLIWSETPATPGYGIIQWNVGNNTGNYEFPFGTLNNDYIPFNYNISSAGVQSGLGSISASTYPTLTTPAANNRPLPTGVLNLNGNCNTEHARKMMDRFWIINANNYTTLPTETRRLTYVDDEWNNAAGSTNIISEPDLFTWHYAASGWETLPSVNNATQNQQTIPTSPKYGAFTLGEFKQINIGLLNVDSVICFGQNNGVIQFSTTVGYDQNTYSWNGATSTDTIKTDLLAGTYTIIATDMMGCADTLNNVEVFEPALLTLNLTSNDESICRNQQIQLTSNYNGGTKPYNLTWSSGQISSNLTNSSTAIFTTPNTTTTYVTVITDRNNCTATDSVFINVNQLPSIDFDADLKSGCQALTVNFTNQSSSAPPITSYTWTLANGVTSNLDSPTFIYLNPGSYSVTLIAISDSGCVNSIIKPNFINVYPNPKADFYYTPPNEINLLNPEVKFENTSIGGYTNSDWNFGDGNTSTQTHPNHFYNDAGVYFITLVVSTIHNCVDSITKEIAVQEAPALYVPNAFTPANKDGRNDVFTVKGMNFSEFEMLIFDRWGAQIHKTNDPVEGWNGMHQNTICPQGVYIYKIYYKFLNGEDKGVQKTLVGHVTLLQ